MRTSFERMSSFIAKIPLIFWISRRIVLCGVPVTGDLQSYILAVEFEAFVSGDYT